MTEDEFAWAISPMIMAVNKPVPPEQLRAWHLILDDLDPVVLQRAVVVTIRKYPFAGYPSVGMIRENAECTSGKPHGPDRVVIAWVAIKKAIGEYGGYASVTFDDPLVNATIRALGGWERFCACKIGEQFEVWLRKEFERTYLVFMANGINAEQAKPLAGLIEINRSRSGHALDAGSAVNVEKILTGLPSLPHLVRGRIDELPPPKIEGPNREFVDSLFELPKEDPPQKRSNLEVDEAQVKAEAIEQLKKWSKTRAASCPS